jgi:hypothetical protein
LSVHFFENNAPPRQRELWPEVVEVPLQRAVERHPRPDESLAVVDQQPQVALRAGQRRRRQCVDSRGQRGPGDSDRVDLIALATLTARAPRARHQPCRDPNHALTARDQEPLQRAGDMAAILQCPDPFTGEAARPNQQRREAANSDSDRLITEQLAGRAIDGGDRVRALVGVRPEHDHGPRPHPFCLADAGRPADRAC